MTSNKKWSFKNSTKSAFLPASTDMGWHLKTRSFRMNLENMIGETLQPNISLTRAAASLISILLNTQETDVTWVTNKIAQFGTSLVESSPLDVSKQATTSAECPPSLELL